MDSRVSLSQYFGSDAASEGQFFDELVSSNAPGDIMTQSVNLQETESGNQPSTAGLFPNELVFAAIPPAVVSTSTSLPAANLPDPSTFFDTVASDTRVSNTKSPPIKPSADFLSQSLDAMSVKEPQGGTEVERRRDAWIPSEETKKVLLKAQAAPIGSFFPEREALTTPGIILEEELPDHLQETAIRLLGVGEAASRGVLRQEHVSRDEAGLRELIRSGYLRAAVSLTGTLISALGQGVAGLGRPTKHSPRSLQLWLTRLALMARLGLHEPMCREAEALGDLGRPDMFYQFYPEQYGARAGSLAPFSLRLLLAELPLHAGRPADALDRLYSLRAVVRKMLSHLREGRTEDGAGAVTPQDQAESLRLWGGRETRILHSLVNCAVALKDFRLAIKTTEGMVAAGGEVQARALLSALCRLCLQAGHVRAAERYLERARVARQQLCPTPDVREYVDQGLLEVAQGRYQEAYNNFARAADQEPTNVMVANNSAVCLLYMGKLKEAIGVLQKAIGADPERALAGGLLLNLCTLHELESSETRDRKMALLRLLCKYKSDTLPSVTDCLKLT